MKNIKKIGKAVAGSALLVGATLAGAASFAAAQSGSSGNTLGDYPAPYVGEDGNVDASIVVGSSAKAMDVVGAVDIAGSLSQAAYTSETVSAGSGSFGWSATNGVSLDTRNDQLFYGQTIDEVRQTLTDEQLDVLSTETVFSSSQRQDLEHYLYIGDQSVSFGNPGDTDDEDPFLYVTNPDTVNANDAADYLYRLQANFEDGAEFYDSGEDDGRNEDIYGEEFEMFGNSFTVAEDSFAGDNAGQLVLYGSQQTTSIDSGDSTTLTVGGEEATIEVVAVTGPDTVAFRINGELREENENDEFTVNNEEIRIDDIVQTNEQNSEGVATFAVGSEQLILEDGQPVAEGQDEEDIDGTEVVLSGQNVASGDVTNSNDVELSSVEVAVGADDSDNNYVRAGESFEDPLFQGVEFHFGGLNPDAGEGMDEGRVGEVQFNTDGDDTVTADVGEATLEWAHAPQPAATDGSETTVNLADSDNEDIVVQEGAEVLEDQYFLSDAGDFPHVWEVTSIDRESDNATAVVQSDDEATIDLRDAVTGAQVEADLDAEGTSTSSPAYVGTEVIDGQTYNFHLDADSNGDTTANGGFKVTWDSSSSADVSGVNTGERTSLYSAVDAPSGTALAVTEPLTGLTAANVANDGSIYELPSTESTDAQLVNVSEDAAGTSNVLVDVGNDGSYEANISGTGSDQVEVGGLTYQVDVTGDNTFNLNVYDTTGTSAVSGPAAAVIQPEDDTDSEEAYIHVPGVDTTDDEIDAGGSQASVVFTGGDYSSQVQTLDSDDDMEVSYNFYGTHTMQDTEDQGSFTLHIPYGQSTAGAAFTGEGGELSGSDSGAGSVTTQTPAGWGDVGALDSDSNIGQLKNNRNLILVGGPVVNSLVQELANAGETQPASDYSEGQAMVQQIDDAFSQGNDAIVVAGQTKEDTREAANFLADYESNQDRMAGSDKVELTTAQSTQ